jgi:cardiolipin synthase
VADTLAEDFAASWEGGATLRRARFGSLELMSLDGIRNASAVDSLLARIRAARLSVEVISPYLTDPFLNALIEARRSGTRVTIVTPAGNNRGFLTRHVVDRGLRGGCDVRLREGMSHLKALLIDGTHLVVGSSNFDWLTYARQREILAIIEDRRVIRRFRAQVLEPDVRRSRPARLIGRIPGCLAAIQLAAVRRLAGDPTI